MTDIIDFPITERTQEASKKHIDAAFERGMQVGMYAQHLRDGHNASDIEICRVMYKQYIDSIITLSEMETALRFLGINYELRVTPRGNA